MIKKSTISPISKIKDYLSQSDCFLNQGEEELIKGDIRQSGEKFWGAAAQSVKAYAEFKGYQHDGHAFLFKTVSEISKEMKDKSLMNQFSLAGMLHTNFYEGWLTKDEVATNKEQVKEFCDKINKMLDGKEVLKK